MQMTGGLSIKTDEAVLHKTNSQEQILPHGNSNYESVTFLITALTDSYLYKQ